jgi:hypothetical protein
MFSAWVASSLVASLSAVAASAKRWVWKYDQPSMRQPSASSGLAFRRASSRVITSLTERAWLSVGAGGWAMISASRCPRQTAMPPAVSAMTAASTSTRRPPRPGGVLDEEAAGETSERVLGSA